MATRHQSRASMTGNVESTAPAPVSFMSPDQLERYLHDLRHNRPARPSGARPLGERSGAARTTARRAKPAETVENPTVGVSVDVPQPLSTNSRHSIVLPSSSRTPGSQTPAFSQRTNSKRSAPYDIPYYERGQRWMERQETHSLTRALQDMDVGGDARVYAAAQKEAAQLVWKHQNPSAAYHNPDFDYRDHLRKGSHARSQSIGPFKELHVQRRASTDELSQMTGGSRKVSSGSNGTQSTGSSGSRTGSRYSFSGSLRERAMNSLPLKIVKARNVSGRRMSGREVRKSSDKSGRNAPFTNPEDKIYEEPTSGPAELAGDSHQPIQPLRVKSRNTSYGKPAAPLDDGSKPKIGGPRGVKSGGFAVTQNPASISTAEMPRFKNGVEIRNDEIRAATSMKLKDRSTKLPQPSAVSDVLGRPIVSFDPGYRPPRKETTPRARDQAANHGNAGGNSYSTPSIQFDEVPTIAITPEAGSAPSVPSISVETSDDVQNNHTRPTARSRPRHQPQIPTRSAHWSLADSHARPRAQCAACALGIQGKVVSAANQRFHPQCFSCYQCGELLECVAFYPEPDQARTERLTRHEALMNSHHQNFEAGHEEDGDPSLRFYCHLDFHENFSPRCKNCKTPIEGKVVVACGAEWHEGHFFCAQCGDPFDQKTPFIEKEGYAWCVPCHTRRFSGKCAGCRKPITDMVVNALEKEWHEECFCCLECGSQFDDGRFFTNAQGENPICVRCEERRLKA